MAAELNTWQEEAKVLCALFMGEDYGFTCPWKVACWTVPRGSSSRIVLQLHTGTDLKLQSFFRVTCSSDVAILQIVLENYKVLLRQLAMNLCAISF